MKLKLLSTLIAVSVLAGCSSGGSSNDIATATPDNGPIEVDGEWGILPPEQPPVNEQDHFSIDANGNVYKNGEQAGHLDTTTGLITQDGVVIGSATWDGKSFEVTEHSSMETYRVQVDKHGNLTFIPMDKDGGWDHVGTPESPIEVHPENPIETGGQYSIDAEGNVYNNGAEVASLDLSTGLISVDGVVIGRVDSHDLKAGKLVIVDHSSGNTYNVAIDKSGNLTFSPADVDAGWGLSKQPKLDELKTNLQSLSKEQRQQLRQTVKSHANTRS